MAGVQTAGGVANVSTRLVTEFGQAAIMALLEEGVDLPDEIVQLIMPPDSFV